jgi:preprotein translocase subunit SecE
MARTNPFEFAQEVRQEVARVTWPSRKETMITTIMVLIMVVITAMVLMGIDTTLSIAVNALLQAGRS